MKNRSKVFIVLGLLLLSGMITCLVSCSQTDTASSSSEDTVDSTTAESVVNNDVLHSLIADFYDAMYEVNFHAKQHISGTLSESIFQYGQAFSALLQYVPTGTENSLYVDYIIRMQKDYFTNQVSGHLNKTDATSLYQFTDEALAYVLSRCTEEVLTAPLPFEHETQQRYYKENDIDSNLSYSFNEWTKDVSDFAYALSVSGARITHYGAVEHLTYEFSLDSDYGPLRNWWGLYREEIPDTPLGRYGFYALFPFDDWRGKSVTSVSVNGVEFTSTQLRTYDSSFNDYYSVTAIMYDSSRSALMNTNFNEFKSTLSNSSTLDILINNECLITLDKEKTDDIKAIMALFEFSENLFLAHT